VATPADSPALTAMSVWLILDASLLLLCASMYLGTGWSLVLFSFPSAPSLTVDNYYEQFVPPVERATRFFTWMTAVMVAAAVVLIVAERESAYVAAPAALLVGVVAATALTIKFIFPYNKQMEGGITDNEELHSVLGRWVLLNWIRVALWTVEWLAIAAYFALHLR
jgi:Mn2+/Fe2+ NRAMP family transporter